MKAVTPEGKKTRRPASPGLFFFQSRFRGYPEVVSTKQIHLTAWSPGPRHSSEWYDRNPVAAGGGESIDDLIYNFLSQLERRRPQRQVLENQTHLGFKWGAPVQEVGLDLWD